MMKKHCLFALLMVCMGLFAACDDCLEMWDPQPAPASLKHLIRTVDWKSFNVQASYQYNTDSTLKEVIAGNGTGIIHFQYEQHLIKEIDPELSLYKNIYKQNSSGQIISIEKVQKHTPALPTYRLEFQYNTNGTLAQLDYFDVSEAGSRLVYSNAYIYDNQGLLIQIVAASSNGNTIFWQIEGYSDPFDFDPLVFTSTDLTAQYAIYNYPLLKQLGRLPKKVTMSVKANQQAAATVEEIHESIYSITNRKLERAITTIDYPTYPSNNSRSEVEYTYY